MVPEGDPDKVRDAASAKEVDAASAKDLARRRALLLIALPLLPLLAGVLGFLIAWWWKPTRHEEIRTETVVAQIRRIAKLATVEAHEAQIVKVDESMPVLRFFESRKNALLLVKGRVVAGVDLEKARIDVLDEGGQKTLRVALPEAEIVAVDPEVEFYSETAGWWNPITPEDRSAWVKLAREELLKAAEKSKVKERARRHAETLIEGVGVSLGYRVEIEGAAPATLRPLGPEP